mmetsp:Transcript_5092/g.8184  ORF Transcript_5092/g.8184 Transcript_5092/m.8184 type:complete len:204 (-) Transcript_5092:490-1101(-)
MLPDLHSPSLNALSPLLLRVCLFQRSCDLPEPLGLHRDGYPQIVGHGGRRVSEICPTLGVDDQAPCTRLAICSTCGAHVSASMERRKEGSGGVSSVRMCTATQGSQSCGAGKQHVVDCSRTRIQDLRPLGRACTQEDFEGEMGELAGAGPLFEDVLKANRHKVSCHRNHALQDKPKGILAGSEEAASGLVDAIINPEGHEGAP